MPRQVVPFVFGRAPSAAERVMAAAASLALLLAVGGIDEATGEHVLLDALYLVPVLVSTWFLGAWGGAAIAVLSCIMWGAVRMIGADFPELPFGLVLWNSLMRLSVDGTMVFLLSRARHEGFTLRSALDHSRKLPDVIPICAWCRKLRDERSEWQSLEQFLSKESDVLLTHGVCADCAARLVQETAEIERDAASGHPERAARR